ncbi:MAG: SMP-30/gluconolactonase/LRE family protein [Vicinamibacterales bacterium]
MTPRRPFLLISVALLATTSALVTVAQRGPAPPRYPGYQGQGITLLPNGWKISPAGQHLQVGDLPLSSAPTPDGRFLVVSTNGYTRPSLNVVDLEHRYISQRLPVDHAWLGLAWHPDGKRLYASGASQNTVNEFAYANGRLTAAGQFVIARPERSPSFGRLENAGFVGGLAVHPNGHALYAVTVFGKSLTMIDLDRGRVSRTIELDAEPYTCLVSPDGTTLFVSLWGGAKVLMFDPATLEPRGTVPVGDHPNAMALDPSATRLFVACANTNAVWVVDTATKTAKEQISVALYPQAPAGTTPNAVGLSPDGKTLLVANADNNTVAVVDVSDPARSEVAGFVPVGWYPTDVRFDRDAKRLLVLSGKGLASSPNPRGPSPGDRGAEGQYIGQMLQGSLSFVDVPDKPTLAAMSKRVYELTPYSDARKLTPADAPTASPIPRRVGDPSPIKYVFYVIRENRTYDQVLGDLERGNGDPSLTLFGETVTPNAHALAREFTVFDNFYVDAEVSYDGHAFSTGAIATDVVEKLWPTNYAGRGGIYVSEGGWEMRTQYGNIAAPRDGYLWDFAKRAGVSVRSYGEFARVERRGGPSVAAVPGLEGLVSPTYPAYDLTVPDAQRLDAWLAEFKAYETKGDLPRLNILRLGNDHTAGTQPGMPTPRAYVAENDQAIGRLVDAISHSRFWNESAVFILEDDAQNGPDHVDAHRSVALVVSPFTKRRAVDSTMYSTSSMLRTMELILGLPPMTQYDAAAAPMYNAFQATPVATPYVAIAARYPLDERNTAQSPGAVASVAMDWSEADLTPELELNQILWQSVHGAGTVMPPPVRAAFVRSRGDADDERTGDDDDDDDEPRESSASRRPRR